MLTDVILPITTTVLSCIALALALHTRKSNRRESRTIQHYGLVAQADNMLAENKACLRFHGINPDTIEDEYGVTSVELSYLLQSFNSGAVSSLIAEEGGDERFDEGSYRYQILENQSTQDAFPLLQKLFDPKNIYMARCEKTIGFIRQK